MKALHQTIKHQGVLGIQTDRNLNEYYRSFKKYSVSDIQNQNTHQIKELTLYTLNLENLKPDKLQNILIWQQHQRPYYVLELSPISLLFFLFFWVVFICGGIIVGWEGLRYLFP